jgi:hypothetical protein
LRRSKTKTSLTPFVSGDVGSRFVAVDAKATHRPSAEIDGWALSPFPPGPPLFATDTCSSTGASISAAAAVRGSGRVATTGNSS